MLSDRDVLSAIPGEHLRAALHSLPDAASSEETTLRVVVDLVDGLRAEVTFARLRRSPHARLTQANSRESGPHWYWMPASAVLIKE